MTASPTLQRAVTVIAMFQAASPGRPGALDTRAYDDCFEMGDGDSVVAILREFIRKDPELARQVMTQTVSYYAPKSLLEFSSEVLAGRAGPPEADIRTGQPLLI